MGETWKFKKDFTIKADVAKAFNEKDVTVKKDYTWIYILVGILLILLALLLIWFIIRKKKKEKEKKEAQKRRKANRKKRAKKVNLEEDNN